MVSNRKGGRGQSPGLPAQRCRFINAARLRREDDGARGLLNPRESLALLVTTETLVFAVTADGRTLLGIRAGLYLVFALMAAALVYFRERPRQQ